ncbi:aldehyde dehydrogenase family protein [Paraconexibacter antarcticus]|uniref:Aldehyde dehydrogenase family protein n=1 Tax=Paraconexibacter antarcticus TaxID=2949664 RepID=A0ABY5DLF9_9ACTN|nr:aldehyde dehydrogenase family protein [Paraconexibacter antarcticus]UTI62660.1 aldehyde dehydrogenase family protein [Paraconexibacter antarcticus]
MASTSVRHHTMFIGGEDVDSGSAYEIRHPATDELVCTMAKGTVADADRAVASAREAFESGVWSGKSPAERQEIMQRIAARIGTDQDEFIAAEISCNGATVRQAAGFHVGMAGVHFDYFAQLAGSYEFERTIETDPVPTASTNTIRREPVGVCAAIVPWNFPLILGTWKIGPALAAGNSVVVKVDEKTPLSLLKLAHVAHEEGVPAGVFNLVSGDGPEVGARLASHPDVDKVAFTGSTAVGREIMRLASGTVKKVTLELGGKGPSIILDDADLDFAVDGVIFGCMLFSGQMCESGTRLLVPAELHDDIVARLVARVADLNVGDPNELATDLGPVISRRQRDRILAYIDGARAEGATIACGGGIPEGEEFQRGHWIAPTIITDITNDMPIAREEVFGPVLSVLSYSSLDEAVAIANDTEYGLSAGVWSRDTDRAAEVGRRLRAGTTWVNTWHAVDPRLPFGGYKQSGLGREIGLGALDEYTEAKHLHVDHTTDLGLATFALVLSTPRHG